MVFVVEEGVVARFVEDVGPVEGEGCAECLLSFFGAEAAQAEVGAARVEGA